MSYTNKLHVFIVNLIKDSKRREFMSNLCKKYNIDYQLEPAVYGKELSNIDTYINYNKEKSIALMGRQLVPGEIGCILSHQNIYKKIIQYNIKQALILEDDILINKDLKSILTRIYDIDIKFDTILLGYHGVKSREDLKLDSKIIEKLSRNYSLTKLNENAHGTYGYIISLEGAKKILSQSKNYVLPIDHYTGNSKLNTVLSVYPQLININDKLSDESVITKEREKAWQNIKEKKFNFYLEKISINIQKTNQQVIIFGFNDFAELVINKFSNQIQDILDNQKYGKIISNIKIKSFNIFNQTITNKEDFIFVITALNINTVKDIINSIRKYYKKNKIITVHDSIS